MVEPIKDKETVREIIEYLKTKNRRDAIMFGLGVFCGFRISEILNLKIKDVRNKWTLKIVEQKTNKTKEVFLNRELKALIDSYTKDMDEKTYLIKSRKGKNKPITRTQAYRIIRDVRDEFELKNIGCHSTRKTFAYWIYMDNKKDIGLAQKALGHGSSATTLTYLGLDKERVNRAVKNIRY